MTDNNTYVDDLGIIYERDEDGVQHVYHTEESWERLQNLFDALDRLQTHLGSESRTEMLNHFEGNWKAMFEAAMNLD